MEMREKIIERLAFMIQKFATGESVKTPHTKTYEFAEEIYNLSTYAKPEGVSEEEIRKIVEEAYMGNKTNGQVWDVCGTIAHALATKLKKS